MPRTFSVMDVEYYPNSDPGDQFSIEPINGTPVLKKGNLVVRGASGVAILTNGAVANLAYGLENNNPDVGYYGPGAALTTTKTAMKIRRIKGARLVMWSSGAAYVAATHNGVNRGVAIDANGRSTVKLDDAVNAAVKVIGLAGKFQKATNGEVAQHADGDTGVALIVEPIDSACW